MELYKLSKLLTIQLHEYIYIYIYIFSQEICKFITSMVISNLCDYIDVYVVVKGTITIIIKMKYMMMQMKVVMIIG